MEDNTIEDALTTLAHMLSKKEYAEAEEFWLKQSDDFSGHSYWHNLALVYRLQGKISQARFAYEKAKYYSIYSHETQKELDAIVETIGSKSLASDPFHPGEWVASLGPYKIWVAALVVCLVIISFLKRSFSLWVNVLIAIFSLLPLIATYLFFEKTIAFVNFKPLPIYNGASQLFASGQYLPEGSRLIGVPKQEWVSLRSSSGELLWVRQKDLVGEIGLLWE